jgi:hypothetical protein
MNCGGDFGSMNAMLASSSCRNLNGIESISPGLRGTSYPGLTVRHASTPTGLHQGGRPKRCNPFRVKHVCITISQGSSSLATLGWIMESLRDSRVGATRARDLEPTITRNGAEIWRLADAGELPSRVVDARVPPLQGGKGLCGPSSQGVALGCRVAAPLARRPTGAMGVAPGGVNHMPGLRTVLQPEGLQPVSAGFQPEGLPLISPGQRPGNSASHKFICPERATPGPGHAQARDLEQTVASDVAEILEA